MVDIGFLRSILSVLLSPGGRLLQEAEDAIVTVSMRDSAFHVLIGDVELGINNTADPDASVLNPNKIVWTQEFDIITHKTPGRKYLTQCMSPDSLWCLSINWNALKGANNGLSQELITIRDHDAGPWMIFDKLFDKGKCMYYERKEITKVQATKDWYHQVQLNFKECNSGGKV